MIINRVSDRNTYSLNCSWFHFRIGCWSIDEGLFPPITTNSLPLLASIQLLDPWSLKYGCRLWSIAKLEGSVGDHLVLAGSCEPSPEAGRIPGISHPFHLRYEDNATF